MLSVRNVHVMLFIKQLPLVQIELSAENPFAQSSEGWSERCLRCD